MSIYHANDFVLDMPDSLKDKTVHIFASSEAGPSECSVVIARERVPSGVDLFTFVERQLQMLAQRAPLFRLVRQAEATIDKQRAIAFEYTWVSQEGKMHQRQVVTYVPRTQTALMFTVTCKEQIPSKWVATFEELLASVRVRP